MNLKLNQLLFICLATFFALNGLQAQQKGIYTVEELARLENIKQSYLEMGIPENWAEKRAKTVFESTRNVETRSTTRNPVPAPGSIWIDRDASGANYSIYHNYTPEEFVKKIFVKDADLIGSAIDDIIKNVKFVGVGWNDTTEVWRTGVNDRSLHYFDHGDITSTVKSYDGITDVPRFGIEKGFLLSTGGGLTAEGKNEFSNFLEGGIYTTNYTPWVGDPGTYPPDPDLQGTIVQPLGTQTILEFDFKPFVDSISFEYIFASTEFKIFSNTPFNDAFGFFVTGPDLQDEWGNTGPTINIARYPNGDPVAVNTSNWGFRDNWFNRFVEYDPLGPTPPLTSGYGLGMFGEDSCATNPEWHVPVYSSGRTNRGGVVSYQNCDTTLMEYHGHSVVLTAKTKLKRGQWYHMKLAIGNVRDHFYGSGTFLKAGSFDLGAPESDIPRPYVKTPYDSIYGWNSLYADCKNTLKLEFPPASIAQTLTIWSEGSGANYLFDADSGKFFADSIKYYIPANDSILNIKFKVDGKVKNGTQAFFYSKLQFSTKKDTSDIFDLYAKSKTALKYYSPPTTGYTGRLDFQTANGSPYIQRSLDNGLTWEFARDILTGESLPFTQSQIANIEEDNFYVIFREPNTCCNYDTVFINRGSGFPSIERLVVMPKIDGAISNYPAGDYYINSREDFVFTLTPTGIHSGMTPVVTTSRTSISDSEGVIIMKNDDGTYTITIRRIQEPIKISVSFVTSIESVESHKIWSTDSNLFIQSFKTGEAQVYTVSGTLICSEVVEAGSIKNVQLPKGFYIVNLNGQTDKIIIK